MQIEALSQCFKNSTERKTTITFHFSDNRNNRQTLSKLRNMTLTVLPQQLVH